MQTPRDNQNLQNTANQRSEELKPNRHVTGAGETSKESASSTEVDGALETDNRDIETFNAADRSLGGDSGLAVGDDRDRRNH